MIKKISILSFFGLMILFTNTALSQIQFNGSIDIGVRVGGENSSFVKNSIESEYRYTHFRIPQVNLFIFAPINDTFFFEARLQTDTWGTGELKDPYFTLANITWADPKNDYSIKAGRFISPVGFYSNKTLLLDRSFHDLPLSYSYFVNISDQRGYWPLAGEGGSYTSNDVGLTSIYFGGYATGGLFEWDITEDKTNLKIGITSVASASDKNYTNLANGALLARFTIKPDIKWHIGFTATHGSFMREGNVNNAFRPFNPLERYRQSIIGTDVKYGLGYWQITAEAIYSYWYVPVFGDESFQTVGASNTFQEENFSNLGTNIDFRFEPTSLPGSYLALRLDYLNFIGSGKGESTYLNNEWDKDIGRISAAFGYKLARNVELKITLSDQTPFDSSFYTFRSTVSAFF